MGEGDPVEGGSGDFAWSAMLVRGTREARAQGLQEPREAGAWLTPALREAREALARLV